MIIILLKNVNFLKKFLIFKNILEVAFSNLVGAPKLGSLTACDVDYLSDEHFEMMLSYKIYQIKFNYLINFLTLIDIGF